MSLDVPDAAEPVPHLRAVAHALRLRMLSLLTGAELSAAEVARELGTTQANASYHLRVLAAAGLLEVSGTESVRGGVAKRYRYVRHVEQADGRGSEQDRQALVSTLAAVLTQRFADRLPGSASHMMDAELWVTQQVWDEVLEHLRRASALIHDNARAPRTEGTVRASLTAAAFQLRHGSDS